MSIARPPLTDAERRHVLALYYERGCTLRDIARLTGFDWRQIRTALDADDARKPSATPPAEAGRADTGAGA